MIFPEIRDTTFGQRRKRKGALDRRHVKIMAQLIERDGIRCHWCRIETTPAPKNGRQEPTTRTRDHLIPVAERGPDTLGNSVIACFDCNQRRGRVTSIYIAIARLHLVAPNRLFGCLIRGGEGI